MSAELANDPGQTARLERAALLMARVQEECAALKVLLPRRMAGPINELAGSAAFLGGYLGALGYEPAGQQLRLLTDRSACEGREAGPQSPPAVPSNLLPFPRPPLSG